MGFGRFFLYPIIVVLSAVVPASAQARASLPIVYVSLQRIMAEANDAKLATKELDELRSAKTQELATKKQALDATRLQVANAGGYFSGDKRARLVEVAKRQELELQQATQQAQSEFVERQKTIQDRLRAEVNTLLVDVARQRGAQYVLNQDGAVLLAPQGADLTSEVLTRMNAASASRQSAAPAAPEATPSKR